MFLVQVPAPKPLVVLIVRKAFVNGRSPIFGELLRGTKNGTVARTEEGCNWNSFIVRINNCTMPHTLVPSIAQCLLQICYRMWTFSLIQSQIVNTIMFLKLSHPSWSIKYEINSRSKKRYRGLEQRKIFAPERKTFFSFHMAHCFVILCTHFFQRKRQK